MCVCVNLLSLLPTSDTIASKINYLIFSGAQWKLQHHQAEEPVWRVINAGRQLKKTKKKHAVKSGFNCSISVAMPNKLCGKENMSSLWYHIIILMIVHLRQNMAIPGMVMFLLV